MHPHSPAKKFDKTFAPSDIPVLARAAQIPRAAQLAEKLVAENLKSTHHWVSQFGGDLVLRDHSHSDFNVGGLDATPISTSLAICGKTFDHVLSLVTVRDPRDSFASLVNNGWVHFEPQDFDTYCAMYHRFLDAVEGIPVVKYEDFVNDPEEQTERMAGLLDLSFDKSATDTYSLFKLSGDSGRGGRVISNRGYRDERQTFTINTECQQALMQRLGYEP